MGVEKSSYLADGKNRFCHSVTELKEIVSKKYGADFEEPNARNERKDSNRTDNSDFSRSRIK